VKVLQFGFVIFWLKEISASAAREMLVKLTTVVYGEPSIFFIAKFFVT